MTWLCTRNCSNGVRQHGDVRNPVYTAGIDVLKTIIIGTLTFDENTYQIYSLT